MGIWRSALIGVVMVIAASSLAQADDPFEWAPGPAPLPHAIRPAPKPKTSQPVAPAGPAAPASVAVFDGRYGGGAPAVAVCTPNTYVVDVAQGKVVGFGNNGQITWGVWGTLLGDGSFSGMHGSSNLTGKFQNGTFEGAFMSPNPQCGRRTLTLRAVAPAGPVGVAAFDGRYAGEAPPTAACPAHTYEVSVSQGTVAGFVNDGTSTFGVWGTVSGDGSFAGMRGTQKLNGKFQNGTFEGTFMAANPKCGSSRPVTLRRDASP